MAKTIIRVQKNRENPYVMLDKYCLYDERLSWKAKGLLAYLVAQNDNWEIREEDLIKKSKDGRDSVRAGLNELKDCGYLEVIEERDEKGQFMGVIKIVHERPIDVPTPTKRRQRKPKNEPVDGKSVNGSTTVDGKSVDGKTADGKSTPNNKSIKSFSNKSRSVINESIYTDGPKQKKSTSNSSKPPRDERYAAFYKLFPDLA